MAEIDELLSFASDMGMTDAERWRLALILSSLLEQSWREGYSYGSYSAAADVLFHAPKHESRIISH
jgi:hypothetical protein